MTRKDDRIDDAALDALLADLRDRQPTADAALMARVLDDARAVQAGFSAPAATRPARPRRSANWLADLLGGWPGASALAASACVGLIVGFMSPDAVIGYLPGIETATQTDADAGLGAWDLYYDSTQEG